MNKLLKKISALNQASLHFIAEENNVEIIRKFTKESIRILEGDFGFAWGKFDGTNVGKLAYKSSTTPFIPTMPFKKNKFFVSYITIPIRYGDHMYGDIYICYKKKHNITEESLLLSEVIGNFAAQTITINWLGEKEHKNLTLAEKQKETEVLLAQEKLKTEFIANATHELRTPLAIMKGSVDLALLSKGDIKAQKSSLELVSDEIDLLSGILKDLTLLTSIRRNAKDIMVLNQVKIVDLVHKIAGRLKVIAAAKKITIKTKGDSNIKIPGDKNYLEKLFLNLIKNAITYGKEGGYIEVEIQKLKNEVKIQISDNGIGISEEDLPQIFERFYRADKSHTSSGNHTGLGLAIAKWVAEIHGGSIEVKSSLGKGSQFIVLLPLKSNK